MTDPHSERKRRLSRRAFLGGAAAAAAGLPFLPSLVTRGVAQPPAGPKRLLCIFTHNHQTAPVFLPTGSERSFTLGPVLTPLAPFQDRMIVLQGLTSQFHDHFGAKSVLSEADGRGPSIDQVVAQRLGNVTRVRSLELATMTGGSTVSFAGAGLAVPPIDHPLAAFQRVMNAATDDPAAQAIASRQTSSVIDAVMARYRTLSGRISTNERRLVDQHLTELADLEERVRNPAMVRACTIPDPPDVPAGAAAIRDETLFPDVCRAHMDVVATAFSCDVTRVATVMLGSSGSTVTYSWLGLSDVAHDVAHGFRNRDGADIPDAIGQWAAVQTWHAEQIAYLLGRLDAMPEGDDGSTVLDNTVVYWASELGLGETGTHSRGNLPAVLIGGCGGFFDTGRFIDLGGRPNADLLMTLGHAMGFEDITSFGVDGDQALDMLRA